jgi:hypothetical protein
MSMTKLFGGKKFRHLALSLGINLSNLIHLKVSNFKKPKIWQNSEFVASIYSRFSSLKFVNTIESDYF